MAPRHFVSYAIAVAALLVAGIGVRSMAIAGPIQSPSTFGRQIEADQITAHLQRNEIPQAIAVAKRLTETKPSEPAGYNLLGLSYMAARDYANARTNFQKALGLQSDYIPALTSLAQLNLHQKNLDGARANFRAILAKDDKSILAMIGMARVEAAAKNERESVAWLEKAKSVQPGAVEPMIMLATIYMAEQTYDKAISELIAAQRLKPDNAEVLTLLGRAQIDAGKPKDAVATLNALVSLRPNSPEALRALASAQFAAKDIPAATVSLNKSLALKPDYVDGLASLALVELHAGRQNEAIKIAKKIQGVAPTSVVGFVLEGDILFQQKNFMQAARAYEKALALQPTAAVAIKVHAAQSMAGKTQEADAMLAKWITNHPNDLVAQMYVAEQSLKKGQIKQAIAQYEAVLQRDPRNVSALNNLANLYQREKDPRALKVAEQAWNLRPESAETTDTLAWILSEQGETARAVELLKRAAEKAPDNAEIRYHLAATLARSGDKASARKVLEALLTSSAVFPQREAAQSLLKQL